MLVIGVFFLLLCLLLVLVYECWCLLVLRFLMFVLFIYAVGFVLNVL